MSYRRLISASALAVGLLFASDAQAITISGSSGGAFSSLTNCDQSGSDRECGIVSSSNGAKTRVRWPYKKDGDQISYASTLTAVDTSFSAAGNADDVILARLDWFNASTSSSITPALLGVTWTLTVAFTDPGVAMDIEGFSLSILNTTNPAGDTISGFTLTDLGNLSFDLDGITIDDFQYTIVDGGGTCAGADTTFSSGVWFNCEDNTASLLITADFTVDPPPAVNEPSTLALLFAGFLGMAAMRRRRIA